MQTRPFVLFRDDHVIAVDKPPGIPVVPAPAPALPGDCLRARVEQEFGCAVWVVHRIDRDASGVVLFARTAEAHRTLCAAFESRTIDKTYLALTAGVPDPPEGTIEIALHDARRGKTRPAKPHEPQSQPAVTDYVATEQWRRGDSRIALVTAHPRTGRHHQLRVHFRAIGTPLVCDPLYGRRVELEGWDDAPCQRLALHAARIVLKAEILGTRVDVSSPLAPDLEGTVRWLAREWSAG